MKSLTLVAVAAVLTLGACSELSRESIERNSLYASLDLNPDEQRIWATLDEAQKARALEFIQSGGTLISSLGDD